MVETTAIVNHPAGLHLRPAALFVQTAARFESKIRIQNLSRPQSAEVDGKSMFGLMQSAVSQGHEIRIRAEGADAERAITELQRLIEHNFEEM